MPDTTKGGASSLSTSIELSKSRVFAGKKPASSTSCISKANALPLVLFLYKTVPTKGRALAF